MKEKKPIIDEESTIHAESEIVSSPHNLEQKALIDINKTSRITIAYSLFLIFGGIFVFYIAMDLSTLPPDVTMAPEFMEKLKIQTQDLEISAIFQIIMGVSFLYLGSKMKKNPKNAKRTHLTNTVLL